MKQMRIMAIVTATTGIMMLANGCSTPSPKWAAPVPAKSDLQFTEYIEATVMADQRIMMDGKKFKVADIPKQLAKKNSSQYITIIVMPESKMTRETLVELVQNLVNSKFYVAIDPKSKYADVPVPRGSQGT